MNAPYQNYPRQTKEPKPGIIFLGTCFGLCVLGFLILQQIILAVMDLTGIYEIYRNNSVFQTALNIPITLISLGLPFYLAMRLLKSKRYLKELPLNPPKSAKCAALLVGLGLLICMFGNFVASAVVLILEQAGVTLTAPEFNVPDGVIGKILFIVYAAVLPALLEEFAIRGVVMQPLRRYGDWFAIVASALIFALMHGNWVQAPFAFIAGIGMGYAVILSGSLWTGIIIHFINNLFSALLSLLQESAASEMTYRVAAAVGSAAIIIFGLVCLAVYIFTQEKLSTIKLCRRSDSRANMFYFIFSPFMVLALGIMTFMTRFYIQAPSNFIFSSVLPSVFLALWAAAMAAAVWNSYRYGKKNVR